jgi:hypothetical protein
MHLQEPDPLPKIVVSPSSLVRAAAPPVPVATTVDVNFYLRHLPASHIDPVVGAVLDAELPRALIDLCPEVLPDHSHLMLL